MWEPFVAEGRSGLTSMHKTMLSTNEKAPFSKPLTKPHYVSKNKKNTPQALTHKHTTLYMIFNVKYTKYECIH